MEKVYKIFKKIKVNWTLFERCLGRKACGLGAVYISPLHLRPLNSTPKSHQYTTAIPIHIYWNPSPHLQLPHHSSDINRYFAREYVSPVTSSPLSASIPGSCFLFFFLVMRFLHSSHKILAKPVIADIEKSSWLSFCRPASRRVCRWAPWKGLSRSKPPAKEQKSKCIWIRCVVRISYIHIVPAAPIWCNVMAAATDSAKRIMFVFHRNVLKFIEWPGKCVHWHWWQKGNEMEFASLLLGLRQTYTEKKNNNMYMKKSVRLWATNATYIFHFIQIQMHLKR